MSIDLTNVPTGTLEPSVPINEAFKLLQALVQLAVEDKDLTAPPTTTVDDAGLCWIVGDSATGAWSGHDGEIALCTGANLWQFIEPKEGWRADVRDEDATYRYSGTAWILFSSGGTAGNKFVNIALSDMTTDLTAATGVAVWFAPEPGTLVDVWIGVHDPSSAGVVRIDMNDSGGSVFTTRPAIDATETTSLTGTAAVLDGAVTFAKGDKFTFDRDDAGADAKGLQAVVEYTPA